MKKVLICDDEKKIRETFYDYLTAKGFDVTLTENGKEAVDEVRGNSFDLVVLDVMMPVLNGLDACREIRRISDVPVLFLSALGEENNLLDGYRTGCDDYIIKPFPMSVLSEKCNVLISRHNGSKLQKEISCCGISIDKNKGLVTVDNNEIGLSGFIVPDFGFFNFVCAHGNDTVAYIHELRIFIGLVSVY